MDGAGLRITVGGKTRTIRPDQKYDDESARALLGLNKDSRALDQLDSAKLGQNRIYEGQVLIDYVNSLFKKKPK